MNFLFQDNKFFSRWCFYTVLILFLGIDLLAAVKPESLSGPIAPMDFFQEPGSDTRKFSARPQHAPSLPAAPVQPAGKQQEQDHRCYLKEKARTQLERMQEPELLDLPGRIFHHPKPTPTHRFYFPFIQISSKTGSQARVRPPPAT